MGVLTGIRRAVGFLAMLLLLQSTSGDALTRHRCAHHDALPAQTTSADHQHHHGDESTPEPESQGCTCVGACTITPVALAPAAQSGSAIAVRTSALSHARAPEFIAPESAEFLLPYSTAPPSAL